MRPPLTYYGGKQRIAQWIISHFPDDYTKLHYVEPFAGGMAVFFEKRRSKLESISDINRTLFLLYKALRDQPEALYHQLDNSLHSEHDLKHYQNILKDPKASDLEKATACFYVPCVSFSAMLNASTFGYALTTHNTKTRTLCAKADLIPAFKKRLKGIQIFNRPAQWFIEKFKEYPDTIMYLDPPYPDTDQRGYTDEFTTDDFNKMLESLADVKFKFLLSFYSKPDLKLNLIKPHFVYTIRNPLKVNATSNVHLTREDRERTEYLLLNYKPKNEQGILCPIKA